MKRKNNEISKRENREMVPFSDIVVFDDRNNTTPIRTPFAYFYENIAVSPNPSLEEVYMRRDMLEEVFVRRAIVLMMLPYNNLCSKVDMILHSYLEVDQDKIDFVQKYMFGYRPTNSVFARLYSFGINGQMSSDILNDVSSQITMDVYGYFVVHVFSHLINTNSMQEKHIELFTDLFAEFHDMLQVYLNQLIVERETIYFAASYPNINLEKELAKEQNSELAQEVYYHSLDWKEGK